MVLSYSFRGCPNLLKCLGGIFPTTYCISLAHPKMLYQHSNMFFKVDFVNCELVLAAIMPIAFGWFMTKSALKSPMLWVFPAPVPARKRFIDLSDSNITLCGSLISSSAYFMQL